MTIHLTLEKAEAHAQEYIASDNRVWPDAVAVILEELNRLRKENERLRSALTPWNTHFTQ